MNADFTHLHLHSNFSLLDSSIRIDELFEFLSQDKAEAVAITDHGNLFGALDFYFKAREHKIRPIIGCEMYMAPGSRLMKGNHPSPDGEVAPYSPGRSGLTHLILLCQNEIGYRNLCKLVSSGYLEGFYYKPRIDKEILKEHTEGLIATSACMKGELASYVLMGDMDKAKEAAIWYRDLFQGRFYLELGQNGLPQQMLLNSRYQELSKDLGIPLIATADCHYLAKKDAFAQEVLMAIQVGNEVEDPSGQNLRTDEFYVKPQEVMKEEFSFCPEAVANTMEIAKACNFEFKFEDETGKKVYHFPKFDPPAGKTQADVLNEDAKRGLELRLKETEEYYKKTFTDEERQKYSHRLERELGVINQMGFTGYFLIVADFIRFGKENGIPVGPGRGSGAGSLVAYSLRITELDPIEHNLLFERFLNPERISLPDFDVDFCMDKRDKVIQYVSEKYGKDCVAQIITFGKLQARGVIRDVGRAFGYPVFEIDKIAKLVPETVNITLEEAFEQEPRLRQIEEGDPKARRLFEVCRSLEGLGRHASIHAAGLVISNRPMVEHCPLYRGKNDELVIQFDMNNADKIGLIKFDFLGLKTLTFLQQAEKLVQSRHPDDHFTIAHIPLTDKPMYDMLTKGDTLGIFQLESSGMQDLMKKVRPDTFEDIVASNALYRPGPLESGMVDDFIAGKRGEVEVKYEFEQLRPILHNTFGVIVYQEQVQQVAMTLASYTAGGADLLRRAMGKKKPEEMAKQKEIFVSGAIKNGFRQDRVEYLFELMAKFAGYGFNKSHAAAYSLITCQTAYLKSHYPVEFFSALLSIERENTDKITKYIADAKRHGISVLPPDVNESHTDFTILSDKEIRFGLGAVKGVGQIAIDSILETRTQGGAFKDLFDLCARTNNRTVNKRVVEALVKAGALDSFKVHRASLMKTIDGALEAGSEQQKTRDSNQNSFADLFGSEDQTFNQRKVEYLNDEPWPRKLELKFEKETIGIFVSGHPLDEYKKELKDFTNGTIAELLATTQAREWMIGAEVASIREIITKRGDRMAFLTLEDTSGQIDAVVFSDVFLENETVIKSGDPLWVKCPVEVNPAGNKMLLSKKSNAQILPLRFAFEASARELHLHLNLAENQTPELDRKWQSLDAYLGNFDAKQGKPIFLHLRFANQSTAVMKLKRPVPMKRETVNFISDLLRPEGVQIEFR